MTRILTLTPSKTNTIIPQQKAAGLIGNNKRRAMAAQAKAEAKQARREEQARIARSQFIGVAAMKLQSKFMRLG